MKTSVRQTQKANKSMKVSTTDLYESSLKKHKLSMLTKKHGLSSDAKNARVLATGTEKPKQKPKSNTKRTKPTGRPDTENQPTEKNPADILSFEGLVCPPDPVYESRLVGMLVQRLMRHGKKQKAYKLTYTMLESLRQKTQQEPVDVLAKAVTNAMPRFEVKSRRVGGGTFQVPYDVAPERGLVLALRWILNAVRQRGGVNTVRKLEDEILLAFKGSGSALKRRDDEHRSAESNRAFIRYRIRPKKDKKPFHQRSNKSGRSF